MGVRIEPERTERLLDRGWCLVSRLHHWLSTWPLGSIDRIELDDLIRDVQLLWTAADDSGLKGLARTCLVIEQFLERFCAKKLVWSADLLADITAAIAVLHDLLLGFEATREEPALENPFLLQKLEQRILDGDCSSNDPADATNSELDETLDDTITAPQAESTESIPEPVNEALQVTVRVPAEVTAEIRSDRPTLEMLNGFVVKIDEICQRLHQRVSLDNAPYFSTTSRLECLAQSTRELVEKMTLHADGTNPSRNDESFVLPNAGDSLSILDVNTALDDPFNRLIAEQSDATKSVEQMQLAETCLPEQVLSDPEVSESVYEPESVMAVAASRPVLVVEESLFYRHLMTLAIRSAGYDCVTFETALPDVLLESARFLAIVVSLDLSNDLLSAVNDVRVRHGIPVIGLTTSDCKNVTFEVDDRVVKSQPGHLIASLNRLLDDSSRQSQKVA